MNVLVRTAEPADFAAVASLTTAVYLADGLVSGPEDAYLAVLGDVRRRAEVAELLVAEDPSRPGGLWGAVSLSVAGGELAEVAGEGEAEFRMLAVAPERRGHGVGEALVRECLRRASSAGRRRVVISCQSHLHTAMRLYRRLGFVRAPERDWEPVPGVKLWVFAGELPAQRDGEHNI
ncbi:GNAT family N-acetyltransferase [Streptomyces profundus]|uniref:GNAT family N-acetyltransferase n=1 Tax=Streptomyces profundus TaxID=2867410 RepID=UPI001D16B767|nr:GNAT family N-acetyltransferase [Streptomyces sp. MA3_2.13]UED84244.1 GNAT family N-acetyltransferase [Streptomyces sp. MA3_2.13]